MRVRTRPIVWEPDGRGWRPVRARVPGRAQARTAPKGSPGPPRSGSHAAGAEDTRYRDAYGDLAQLAELRGVVAIATDIVRELVSGIGVVPTVLLVGFVLAKRRSK